MQTALSEMQSAALSPIQMVKSFLQTPSAEKGDDNSEELAELRRRLTELEAQKTLERKRPAKKTAAKKHRK